jgi:predicted nucleic acid-binding protein
MDKIVFVDANAFLEIALQDKKSEECKDFFKKILANQIKAYSSDFIIYTCLIQLQFKSKENIKKMKEFLIFINSLNITVIKPTLNEIFKVFRLIEKYKLDFDDGLVVSCMTSNNIKTLVSLDKDFDKVDVIKREEPGKI